jgi:2-phosphosulfolactate phosphatase
VKYLPVKPEDFMRVNIVESLASLPPAAGMVAVTVVFRAWAAAYAALESGAGVLISRGPEHALDVRTRCPELLLAGESPQGVPSGFDLPNSPFLLQQADIQGHDIVFCTSCATPAVFAVGGPARVVPVSFVNMGAAARGILASTPAEVALLTPAGPDGLRSLENSMCAMFLKNELEEYPNNFDVLRNHLRTCPAAAVFDDPARGDAPPEDYDFCMSLNRFDYLLELQPAEEGLLRLVPCGDRSSAQEGGPA